MPGTGDQEELFLETAKNDQKLFKTLLKEVLVGSAAMRGLLGASLGAGQGTTRFWS